MRAVVLYDPTASLHTYTFLLGFCEATTRTFPPFSGVSWLPFFSLLLPSVLGRLLTWWFHSIGYLRSPASSSPERQSGFMWRCGCLECPGASGDLVTFCWQTRKYRSPARYASRQPTSHVDQPSGSPTVYVVRISKNGFHSNCLAGVDAALIYHPTRRRPPTIPAAEQLKRSVCLDAGLRPRRACRAPEGKRFPATREYDVQNLVRRMAFTNLTSTTVYT